MKTKPTYEELEQRVKKLEKEEAKRKQAEEKLLREKLLGDSIVDNTPAGIAFLDNDFVLRRCNHVYAELIHIYSPYTLEQAMGSSYFDYVPGSRPQVEEWFQKVRETGKVDTRHGFKLVIERDGKEEISYWDASIAPVLDPDGKINGILLLTQDVTDRKQAEEALRESEEKYKFLSENMVDIVWILDRDFRTTYVSPSIEKVLGFTPEERKRQTLEEMLTPESLQDVQMKFLEELQRDEEGVFDPDRPVIIEVEYYRKDGSTIWMENSVKAIRDLAGEIVGMHGVSRDITDRKHAEFSLRESEEQCRGLYEESKRSEEMYRSLLHSSADAIVIYDFEGRAEYVSPMFTKLFGWTLKEVRGERIPFLPDSEKESTMAIIKDLVESGTPCHGFETKRYTKEGNLLDVSISASRYDDHEGKPVGTFAILRDISEKRKLEAQLQQAQKMEAIGTLAGGIAHDFNNLMMGMLGNVSLVLHDLEPSHPHYEMLKHVDELIQSGSKLTRQLLGFARKGKYEIKPASLNKIVEESSEAFGRTRKEITIKHELAEKPFAVEVDENQILQLLLNLYINAADAMPGGGDLFLQTLNVTHAELKDKQYDPKPGNYVMIKVADQGAGMDEKTMERIFDPFFTTKEMGRGTGLGLASVYGIIKGHGGYIDVDSKKGYGTTFYIYLPASDEQITETQTVSERIEKGVETILLVDDEAMVLDVSTKMLETMGYVVLEAKSGQEAIDIYKENQDKIDLVILDMIMPGIGGGEVFDKMKVINPDVNVLLFSGYSIESGAQEILDRGCKGFIQKPFNLEDLSQKIREILGKDF